MPERARPAAYVRAERGDTDALARQRDAVTRASQHRNWPPPVVYADDEQDLASGHAPELARLAAAIEAGRHDALLIAAPGAVIDADGYLTGLLHRCSSTGTAVVFVLPPAVAGPAVMHRHATGPPVPRPPVLLAREDCAILARARLEALTGLFPGWRIWLDHAGWHARRHGPYLQTHNHGAPAYCVHADTSTALAAQLCWQQAADHHAPQGCANR